MDNVSAHDPTFSQAFDLAGRESQLGQYFVRVFTQQRRVATVSSRRSRQAHERTKLAHGAELGVLGAVNGTEPQQVGIAQIVPLAVLAAGFHPDVRCLQSRD